MTRQTKSGIVNQSEVFTTLAVLLAATCGLACQSVYAIPLTLIGPGTPITESVDINYDGGSWTGTGGISNYTIDPGITSTLNAGFTFNQSYDNIARAVGGGTWVNNGVFNRTTSDSFRLRDSTTFDNTSTGVLNFNANNGGILLQSGNFRNSGGTINVNATGIELSGAGLFTTFDGSALQDLNLVVGAGNDFSTVTTVAGGLVQLNTLTVPAGSEVLFSTPSTFTNSVGGDIVFNQPGKISLGNFGMGTNVILDAGGGHEFANISGVTTIDNNGNNMTLETGRTLDVIQTIFQLIGTGTFFNKGTFNNNSTSLRINSGVTFENTLTGTISKDSSVAFAQIRRTSGSSTFNNLGTIFVPGGELEIVGMTFNQFSAGSLTGGTYIVDSTATAAATVLDLQVTGGDITTIANGTTVKLIGADADFVQLTNTLANLDGTLSLENGQQFTVDTLTMNGLAELQFGLLDTASSNAQLTVTNALTANGIINILDSGGLETGIYDLINFSGLLTDDGITLGSIPSALAGFDVSLIVPASGTTGGVIQLSIESVPEPSSFMLLGLGALGWVRHTRRRRRGVE